MEFSFLNIFFPFNSSADIANEQRWKRSGNNKGKSFFCMDSLTFCNKIVILLNGLLVESLVGIHLEHLSASVKVMPLGHHYWVDDHWIVLMLDSHDGQRRRHLIFRWPLRAIALIVAMIDNLYGWIRSNYLVDWLKCNTVPIGCERKRKNKRN